MQPLDLIIIDPFGVVVVLALYAVYLAAKPERRRRIARIPRI